MTSSDILSARDDSSTSSEDESSTYPADEQLDLLLKGAGTRGDLEDQLEVQVVSFPGLSQYSMGGPSACGLIAMNCVRKILSLESEGKTGRKLINEMLKAETVRVSLEL